MMQSESFYLLSHTGLVICNRYEVVVDRRSVCREVP